VSSSVGFHRNTTFLSDGCVFPRENSVVVRWFPPKHDFPLGRVRISKRKQCRRPLVSTETRLFSRTGAYFQEKTVSSSVGFHRNTTFLSDGCVFPREKRVEKRVVVRDDATRNRRVKKSDREEANATRVLHTTPRAPTRRTRSSTPFSPCPASSPPPASSSSSPPAASSAARRLSLPTWP
jgi:hypothetical protein